MNDYWVNVESSTRSCSCGSGEWAEWIYDARGIELCKACPSCRKDKLKGYRPDVLEDSNYWTDEPVDPTADDLTQR